MIRRRSQVQDDTRSKPTVDGVGTPRSREVDDRAAFTEALLVARRALWCVLIPEERASLVIEHVPELAGAAHRVEYPGCGWAVLVDALTRMPEQHRIAAAIARVADERDEAWAAQIRKAMRVYRAARDRLVLANLPVVASYAKRFGRNDPRLADRIQDGSVGLLEAIDRFDPGRGVWLSTYAASWILHSMTRALTRDARTVRIPAHVQQLFRTAERARRRLAGELGRAPTLEEVATAIGADPERLAWAVESMQQRTVVLNHAVADASGSDELPDETWCDPLERMIARRDERLAMTALRQLPPRQRDILQHRFAIAGAPVLTLDQIGGRHGISRERVRQLQGRALDGLRQTLERAHSG